MAILSSSLANPFHDLVVEDTWARPPADVPEFHHKAFEKFLFVHDYVRKTAKSASLLVQGSAGSGKTHLVARLRQHLHTAETTTMLVWVRLSCTVEHLWRYIRRELVEELLHLRPDKSTALQRILQNQFPGWAPVQPSGSIFGNLFGNHGPEALIDCLRKFDAEHPIYNRVLLVLSVLFDPKQQGSHQAARAWLRGDELTVGQLAQLSLQDHATTEREEEIESREIVKSLCRLAGRKTTLCLCFDQIEGLQLGTRDLPTLAAFATAATDLVADTHSALLSVTFCRSDVLNDIKAAASQAVWDRLNANTAVIPPLTWEQMVRIYIRRLDSEPTLRAAREGRSDPYWPLGESFLRALRDKHQYDLTPRHFLTACRGEFSRRQCNDEEVPPDPPIPPPPATAANGTPKAKVEPAPESSSVLESWLNQEWERLRKVAHARLDGINFDLVMSQGLVSLLEATRCPVTLNRPIPEHYADYSLVFTTSLSKVAVPPLGISLCDHDSRRLPPRLKRLKEQWRKARKTNFLGEMVVLRPARLQGGKVGEQLLGEFNDDCCRLVRVHDQQLAEMAATQRLFQSARNGDLTRIGPPIDVKEVSQWATRNMPSSIRDLLHTVFGDRTLLPTKTREAMTADVAR